MPDSIPILTIAQGAQLAREAPDRRRRYLGQTEDGMPLWSCCGHVVARPAGPRPIP
jgi:hypothetical protein